MILSAGISNREFTLERHNQDRDDQHRSPIQLGSQLMAGKLRHQVQPIYPKEALIKGIQGVVKLHTIVARDGSVGRLEVISGPEVLRQAAVEAVRQWQYEPTIWKGETVEVDTIVDIVFQLRKAKPTKLTRLSEPPETERFHLLSASRHCASLASFRRWAICNS